MKSLAFILLFLLFLGCETDTSDQQPAIEEIVETETNDTIVEISTPSNNTNAESLFLLQREKAGLFEIGIAAHKVEMIAAQNNNIEILPIDRMIEGMPAPALEVTINETKALLLEISETDSLIYRIQIETDLFKTVNGIGIGSSYQDLEANYTFDQIHWGDEGQPVVIIEEDNFSFMLESGDWWQNGEVSEEVPAETKVTKIILW